MLRIDSINAFNDNYIWVIRSNNNSCAVVDPGDASPVIAYLAAHKLKLDAILITHHHKDHTAGLAELSRQFPGIDIIGPAAENIAHLTTFVNNKDNIKVLGQIFKVLSLPGHTLGHVAYVGQGLLFCGDTLFSAGCGRLFEGSAEQMYLSLEKLADLPDDTKIYCAHEYTLANLNFSLAVEPKNKNTKAYQQKVIKLRAENKPSLPSSLRQEKLINPFLRCHQSSVIEAVKDKTEQLDPLSVFSALRAWKDIF